MKFNRQSLLEDLKQRTQHNRELAIRLHKLPSEELNRRPGPDKWSALECIEHLNRYGDFYLPEIEDRITRGGKHPDAREFRSGWLGNYFAKSVAPLEEGAKPMKTFKSMNPLGSELELTILDKFIKQQDRMLALLHDARYSDLTRTRTAISISKLIKLRIGDTLRVVIYHNCRHMDQALKACGVERVASGKAAS